MRRRTLLLLAAALLALGAGGCGGAEDESATPETVEGTLPTETTGGGATQGDPEAGKAIFAAQGCGGCHTLKAAGSSGTIGPNLDRSKVDFQRAFKQITTGGGGMPPFGDKLSDKQIADAAAFVTEKRSG